MLSVFLLLLKKDFRLTLTNGSFTQALLVGLMLIFLLGMATSDYHAPNQKLAASSFWLASLICVILTLPRLYQNDCICKSALLAMGIPARLILLNKTVCAFILLIPSQLVFLTAIHLFFNGILSQPTPAPIIGILLCNAGLCILVSLLSPLSNSASGPASSPKIASLIIVPVSLPILLVGTSILAVLYSPEPILTAYPAWRNILFILSIDLILLAAALILFPIIFKEHPHE